MSQDVFKVLRLWEYGGRGIMGSGWPINGGPYFLRPLATASGAHDKRLTGEHLRPAVLEGIYQAASSVAGEKMKQTGD